MLLLRLLLLNALLYCRCCCCCLLLLFAAAVRHRILPPEVVAHTNSNKVVLIYCHSFCITNENTSVHPWQYCRFCAASPYLYCLLLSHYGHARAEPKAGVSPPRRSPACICNNCICLELHGLPQLCIPCAGTGLKCFVVQVWARVPCVTRACALCNA